MDITGIGSVLDFGGKLIDRLWPDPAQRDAAKLELFRAQQAGEFKEMDQAFELAKSQIGVNNTEASNSSFWVSGARPACVWVGAAGMAYAAILDPLLRFAAAVGFGYTGVFPVIDTTITTQVLLGLLGLGYMRSLDKKAGVAS